MKLLFLSCAVLMTAAGVCFVTADEQSKSTGSGSNQLAQAEGTPKESKKKAPAKKKGMEPADKAAVPAKPAETKAVPPATPKRSPDEEAVVQIGADLAKAYNDRSGKAFAAIFTADGEFVDEKGAIFHGRQAIEDEFAAFFKAHPETSIEVELVSTRGIAPSIIAADGITRLMRSKAEPPIAGRCGLVCTKDGGKWMLASLRESPAAEEHTANHEHVRQLEFLVGEWVNEGPQSRVHFACRWDEGLNFLLRDFAVHVAGQKTMTGTQRIGFDPLTGHLKAWIFDSAGGYADGFFHREGASWVLQTSGVTADGHMAAGTQVFTPLDKHRLSWQPVNYVIGGEQVADIPKVTIVRKPPAAAATSK